MSVVMLGPSQVYQTYTISQRPDRWIKVACEHVGCERYLRGWKTVLDERTAIGRDLARWVRMESRRTYREQRDAAGLTVFTFDSHQRCFEEHQTQPQRFSVGAGHFQQPQGLIRVHRNGRDWVEDCGENQQKLAEEQQRG